MFTPNVSKKGDPSVAPSCISFVGEGKAKKSFALIFCSKKIDREKKEIYSHLSICICYLRSF